LGFHPEGHNGSTEAPQQRLQEGKWHPMVSSLPAPTMGMTLTWYLSAPNMLALLEGQINGNVENTAPYRHHR
jgi:hypothetical protein